MKPLMLGAVAYDPKVVSIWDGFARWFGDQGLSFDYELYTNYERQVEAQLEGRIDVAWNSPLAWIQTQRASRIAPQAIVMRDTDQDLRSVIVVRDDGPKALTDIRRVGVGAADSPQATLIPLFHLAQNGVHPEVVRHDVLVGKHGDHIGGERDAARALLRGEVDAACILDANLLGFRKDGTFPPDGVRVLDQTARYDHCNFTVLHPSPTIDRFAALLLAQRFDDPGVRPLMEMEGLTAWRPGRTEGYALLDRAVDHFGTVAAWLQTRG
jgi:phosphonate transport system substrate-binding protein